MKGFKDIFKDVPDTGVIYIMNKARESGFGSDGSFWANLGQGQPELSEFEGGAQRCSNIKLLSDDLEYAPVSGIIELRQAIADHYNYFYRKGKKSLYTHENVSVCPGGRASITRAISTLSNVNVGHFLPDYTAYEELLGSFASFCSIPIPIDASCHYSVSEESLKKHIIDKGLSAILMSNPCNPTGKLVYGDELKRWCVLGKKLGCVMFFDEFYSHYIWEPKALGELPGSTAASCVTNVDRDPVLIFDGLTKNWRYPGFRISWALGPKDIISKINSAGSFLDGGASKPMQKAASLLFDHKSIVRESKALREKFLEKKRFLKSRLSELGIVFDFDPKGTFYLWGDVSTLPEKFNTGMKFSEESLKNKVICIPGEFFDINPGKRRPQRVSRFDGYVRFSFGPEKSVLKIGVDRLEKMLTM